MQSEVLNFPEYCASQVVDLLVEIAKAGEEDMTKYLFAVVLAVLQPVILESPFFPEFLQAALSDGLEWLTTLCTTQLLSQLSTLSSGPRERVAKITIKEVMELHFLFSHSSFALKEVLKRSGYVYYPCCISS
jgi:hypothetical protein